MSTSETPGGDTADAAETLWFALCVAPDEGIGIAELMRITGMSRPTLYRYLAQLRPGGPRDPGRLGPLARSHHRGASR